MSRLSDFWHRFSRASGSGVALVIDRKHPYRDDLHHLQTVLVAYALNQGETNDVYVLCDMAERYGKCINIMPQYEVTSFMQMAFNMMKADLGLPFEYIEDTAFDRMFKAFIGVAVITNSIQMLKEKGWKRFG